jgi:predicted dehydrogenase
MSAVLTASRLTVPRLGFLGLGWIGRHRMRAVLANGAAEAAVLCDISADRLSQCAADAAAAVMCGSIDELLEHDVDGVVIATPSALHADQAIHVLERGLPVFCQKPLARTAAETQRVVDAARAADRLLGIDLSYRHTTAMQSVHDLVRAGGIGDVYAADLVFHNAYGPGDGWARDPRLAGGGCVIDLGIHLIDLAWWVLGPVAVRSVAGQLFAHGRRITAGADVCEDHATATIELAAGTVVRLACSWHSSTGTAAVIRVAFHGSTGGAAMRNVNGSFHDFVAEHYRGTDALMLAAPPDDWGGRALIEWSRRVASGDTFDPSVSSIIGVAATLDAVLGR